MRDDIMRQMQNFSAANGDRIDSVARVCRQLFFRTELCPCRFPDAATSFPGGCRQCQNDREAIEAAWTATETPTQDSGQEKA